MVNIEIEFPKKFYKEETRNGFYVNQQRKELWALEIDLLKHFDNVCKELDVKYYLDAGTLLGAVRHKGFIPWDDDIDVVLFRKDYDLLLKEGSTLFHYPYFLQTHYTDKNYIRTHAQLRNSETTAIIPGEGAGFSFNQGIFIDIFVLDGLTTDEKKLQKQRDSFLYYRSLLKKIYVTNSNNPLKHYLKIIRSKFMNIRYKNVDIYHEMEAIEQLFENSEYVDKIGLRCIKNKYYYLKKDWFAEPVYLPFEGFSFPCPKEYEKILRTYYGDHYMIPKQESSYHGKVKFDTDNPYTIYI